MDPLQIKMQSIGLNEHTDKDGQIHIGERKDLEVLDGFTDWKRIGNEHFAFKSFNDAIVAYTKGMEEGDKSIDIIANRSAAYLRLLQFKNALVDAEFALTINENHIKSIYRKVTALFGIALYRDAMEFLEKISLDSTPQKDKNVIVGLVAKCSEMGRNLPNNKR